MKVLQEEEGEKHPGVGNSSHIHRQIRGHPLREQPPQTHGCRLAGDPWREESEEHLPHPRTTLGTCPTPNLAPTPVAGVPPWPQGCRGSAKRCGEGLERVWEQSGTPPGIPTRGPAGTTWRPRLRTSPSCPHFAPPLKGGSTNRRAGCGCTRPISAGGVALGAWSRVAMEASELWVGFVGAGRMAGGLVRGLLQAGTGWGRSEGP